MARSLELSRNQREADLQSPKPLVRRSAYTSGMEQGLRDLFLSLSIKASQIPSRKPLVQALHQIVSEEYPEFGEREKQRLQRVVERRRIRSENQFHQVRHRVDQIEGLAEHEAELELLYELIGDYEARRTK